MAETTTPYTAYAPPARAEDDKVLVGRVLAGEHDLFEIIMRRYNQRLFRAARAVSSDDGAAEDAVQDAYVSAFMRLNQFEGRASLGAWLTKIAVNAALARRREQARAGMPALDEQPREEVDDHDGPEEEASRMQLRALLESSIEALAEGNRVVFVLRDVQGLSTAEVASSLDLSEEAVRVRLHRARRELRDVLFEKVGGGGLNEVYAFAGARCDRIVLAVLARLFSSRDG